MEYNLKNHSFLLKNKNALSEEEKRQLMKYNGYAENRLAWELRFELNSLFNEFLEKKIDGEGLCDGLHGLRLTLVDQTAKFESDLVSGKIENFQALDSNAMSKLLRYLYFASDDWEENEYDTPEFYNFVQKGILALQDILNENTTPDISLPF